MWELLQDPERGSEALEQAEGASADRAHAQSGEQGSRRACARRPKDGRPKTTRKTDFPSYIPSRTFASALLGLEQQVVSVAKGVDVRSMRKLDESIEAIPSERVQDALTALLHSAQGDAVVFRRSVEQWYDDQMERVSGGTGGASRRSCGSSRSGRASRSTPTRCRSRSGCGSIRARGRQSSARRRATTGGENPADQLDSLPIPLGWHLASARHDPQGFPFYEQPSMAWSLLAKLSG